MKTINIQRLKRYFHNWSEHPERLYLCIALVFGFVFVVITPAFFNADEPNHFFRAYQLSNGDLLAENVNSYAGGTVPVSLIESVEQAGIDKLSVGKKVPKINRALWHIRLDAKKGAEAQFPNTALYSPIVYLPQIVGLEILKPFNPPPVLMLYAGRLLGMIASTVLVFYAIRFLPVGKWVFVAIGLMPMTIVLFASFAADGITIGLSLLLIAYILKLTYSKPPFARRQLAVLGALLVGMGLAKTTYALLAMLVFLPPLMNPAFRKYKYIKSLVGLLFLGLICAFAWEHMTSYIKSISIDGHTNSSLQMKYILHHPFTYLSGPFIQTIITNNNNGIIESMFGSFASLTTPMPYLYVVLNGFILGFSYIALSPSEAKLRIAVGRWTRLFVAAVAFLMIFAIATALYLYWSTVKEQIIEGLQGRYFIPVLALGVVLFSTRQVVVNGYFRAKLIVGSSVLFLVVTTCICLAKFYLFKKLA